MSRLLTLAAALGGFALATHQAARNAERARAAPGRFIAVDGVRLHILDRGPPAPDGPPVVLLHGNGSMVEDFDSSGLIDLLARHRRVVAIDRPGFGRSDRPRDRDWTPEAQAALIAAALERLGLVRPIVLGHSFGAVVALALALDHASRIGGLVLESGYFFPTLRADAVLFSPPAIPGIGDVIRYTYGPPLGRAVAKPMIRRMFAPLPVPRRFKREFPLPLTVRPWQIRAVAEDSAAMVPAARRLSQRLGQLHLPVTILAGEEDRIVSPKRQAQRLHAMLPDSRLVLLPGAGHMLHHASPAVVEEAILSLA
ncbi:alpha/beta hydrolase [Roseomonas stagni]|uniref:Alpha/beta hydrolase n=1 Tax=Falsiroseomonas algicola TaxID=2716930 RepID=A0A6M1LG59_9PROT|nr:alpha/beta hydrolase [Falsiroseomonas algicola]NGM19102.1 alpha/beta hydrolase [Falsiroseomonas algicola]